jgi:hypothetical protein
MANICTTNRSGDQSRQSYYTFSRLIAQQDFSEFIKNHTVRDTTHMKRSALGVPEAISNF